MIACEKGMGIAHKSNTLKREGRNNKTKTKHQVCNATPSYGFIVGFVKSKNIATGFKSGHVKIEMDESGSSVFLLPQR